MPEGSKVSLLPVAWSFVEPLGSYTSKANVRSISKCEQLSSKEKQDGNVETGGASEPPLAHRLALQRLSTLLSAWAGEITQGAQCRWLLCRAAGHNRRRAWQSPAARVSARGCHGNETSANAADANGCFALTAPENIAQIIHSLEIREAQTP